MKQYFKYFAIPYIIFAVLLVVTGTRFVMQMLNKEEVVRGNNECPTERVYDYASVLKAEEEDKLRIRIAQAEEKIKCDIVLVILNEPILDYCGYTENTDANWESAMMNYADDFYDRNLYGYDKVHGDGVLLLDNWYLQGRDGSQAGYWVSTCGAVYEKYSAYMIQDLLDDVELGAYSGRYKAYLKYIEHIERYMKPDTGVNPLLFVGICLIGGLIPAIIFIVIHLKSKEGDKTTTQSTYIDGEKSGISVFKERKDELIDKHISSVRIQTSSSGGGFSGGGGGGHRSSGGVRHGGGGRRR